eukprot:m.239353 g.239353  ORF g.239353 m.239353 type:complete len:452 (+) comp13472_c0_seq1:54-1409(+)
MSVVGDNFLHWTGAILPVFAATSSLLVLLRIAVLDGKLDAGCGQAVHENALHGGRGRQQATGLVKLLAIEGQADSSLRDHHRSARVAGVVVAGDGATHNGGSRAVALGIEGELEVGLLHVRLGRALALGRQALAEKVADGRDQEKEEEQRQQHRDQRLRKAANADRHAPGLPVLQLVAVVVAQQGIRAPDHARVDARHDPRRRELARLEVEGDQGLVAGARALGCRRVERVRIADGAQDLECLEERAIDNVEHACDRASTDSAAVLVDIEDNLLAPALVLAAHLISDHEAAQVRGDAVQAAERDDLGARLLGRVIDAIVEQLAHPRRLARDVAVVNAGLGALLDQQRAHLPERARGGEHNASLCHHGGDRRAVEAVTLQDAKAAGRLAELGCNLVTHLLELLTVAPGDSPGNLAAVLLCKILGDQAASEASRAHDNDVVVPCSAGHGSRFL